MDFELVNRVLESEERVIKVPVRETERFIESSLLEKAGAELFQLRSR